MALAKAYLPLEPNPRLVRKLERSEVDQLRKNFRSYIQPYLSGEHREDYDLIWGWEKFMNEKSEREQKASQAEARNQRGPSLAARVRS